MAIDELSDLGASKGSTTNSGGVTWGLASISLGAVALLVAPIILVLNLVLSQSPRGPKSLVAIYAILMLVGIATMLGLAVVSVGFGWTGRRIDHGDGRASPLATAGILLGAASGIGWIIVGIQTFLILFT